MSEFNELWRLYGLLEDFRSMLGSSEEVSRLRGDVESWAHTAGAKGLISKEYADKVVEMYGVHWLYAHHYGGEARVVRDNLTQIRDFSRDSVEGAIREYVADREKLVLKKIRTYCSEAIHSSSGPQGIVLRGGIRVNKGSVTSMDSTVAWQLTQLERLTYIVAAGKLPTETARCHELGYVSDEHDGRNFSVDSRGLCADVSYTRFFKSISIDGKYGGWRQRNVTLEFKDSEVLRAVLDFIKSEEVYEAVRDKLPDNNTSALDALFNVPAVSQSTERRLRL